MWSPNNPRRQDLNISRSLEKRIKRSFWTLCCLTLVMAAWKPWADWSWPGFKASHSSAEAPASPADSSAQHQGERIPVERPVVSSPESVSAPETARSGLKDLAGSLVVPVAGVSPSELSDTFTDPRSGGRTHLALDIMAPRDTPVLAATDGFVKKLFLSKPGGVTLYQFDPEETYCFYYAHLERYAEGLEEGDPIRRGQLIGYVGSTGTASDNAPHLHFSISKLGKDKRWWEGKPINPYPILSSATGP